MVTSTPSSHRRRADSGSGSHLVRSQQMTQTPQVRCLLPVFPSVSRHERSTAVCCLRPIFHSVSHRACFIAHRAAGSGSPQCHCTRCRLCRCGASCPSSHPSLTGPRGRPPTVSRDEVSTVKACCLRPVFRSIAHRAAGSGRPHTVTSLTTAGAQRLACFSLVSLPARQVSTSRRLGS